MRVAPPSPNALQVLTDVDDTIKSSGGVKLANIPLGGVDSAFKRGVFYPGVATFQLELAKAQNKRNPLRVAVLTARAKEFEFLLKIDESSKIAKKFKLVAQRQEIDWGIGTVLYGSVQEWINQDRKGWRKYQNFKLLHADAPSSRKYVFIGDNGASEQDFEAATKIIDAFPSAMRAVFLHAVSPDTQPAPLPKDEKYNGVPIIYFRTYAAAAVKATELGLLDRAALIRVLNAIESDLRGDRVNIAPGSKNDLLLLDELRYARSRMWLVPRGLREA